MAAPLIFVPRKTTSDVDFAGPLKSHITKTFGESPDSYAEEIAGLNRIRQDALRGEAGSDITARDLLYKYFTQIELLELRFLELRVPFPWNDAFTSKQISQLSIAYEKASVIFNIGATLSSLGASSPRSSPEGLKRAFQSFKIAAGMFSYINENFLHAPSTDLSREVVKSLVTIMLAQATEVFIENMGEKTGKSANLKAKVAMMAGSLYASVVEDVKEWVGKGVFFKEWSYLVQSKAKLFTALAQSNRAVADTASSKHGDALARLTLAESLAKEAHRFAVNFSQVFSTSTTSKTLAPDAPATLVEVTKAHLASITEKKEAAQRDNDMIFHDMVPSETSLAPIEKTTVATPIQIHEVYAMPEVQKVVGGADLFQRLVPYSVHESASLYSEEKAKLVRALSEQTEESDAELSANLESLGLPGALERFRAPEVATASLTDPGPGVRAWTDDIRAREAEGRAGDLLGRLVGARDSTRERVDRLGREMEEEARGCERLRSRFGHLWEQAPSAGLTRNYRADLKAHKDALEAARQSDEMVEGLWAQIAAEIGRICEPGGRGVEQIYAEALAGAMPGGKGPGQVDLLGVDTGADEDDKLRKEAAGIADRLALLNKLKKERESTIKELKEKVQNDDISHILILHRKGGSGGAGGQGVEPSLFATELEKFNPLKEKVEANLAAQGAALAEVAKAFGGLTSSSRAREIQNSYARCDSRKAEVAARLRGVKDMYADAREGITKGLSFYSDLEVLVRRLGGEIDGFLKARNGERNDMAGQAAMQQRLETGSSASNGTRDGLSDSLGGLRLSSPTTPSYGGYASPPPPPANNYLPPQASAYSPAPPSASPYGGLPSTGAFADTTPSPASAYHQSYAQPAPPRPPPAPNSYYQSSTPSYGAAPPPPQQRQPSFPPPPNPVSYSSGLPPPSAPLAYASQHHQQPPPPHNPYAQQYGAPPPPAQSPYGLPRPPPPPPSGYRY